MFIKSYLLLQLYVSNRYIKILFTHIPLLILATILAGCLLQPPRIAEPETDAGADKIMELLKNRGYKPNIGFSAKYAPGTIIQIKSRGANNETIDEITPRVFYPAKDCFPKVEIETSAAVLPEYMVNKAGGMNFGASILEAFLPSLNVEKDTTERYSMQINTPKVLIMPRGKMNGKMSVECRRALEYTIKSGDSLSYFNIVEEVMAADGFTFKVSWAGTSEVSAGFKRESQQKWQNKLSSALGTNSSTALYQSNNDDNRTLILTTDKKVYFAYKARPIQVLP